MCNTLLTLCLLFNSNLKCSAMWLMIPSFYSQPRHPVRLINYFSGGLCNTRRKYPENIWRHCILSYVAYHLARFDFGDRRGDRWGDDNNCDNRRSDRCGDRCGNRCGDDGCDGKWGLCGGGGVHHFHWLIHCSYAGYAICALLFCQSLFYFIISCNLVFIFNFFNNAL
jgi:hypothetical protein